MPQANTNNAPRLSVSKIAEYLSASATRRRRIIRDAKEPPTYIVNIYENAKDRVVDYYLLGENLNAEDLIFAIEHLRKVKPKTPKAQQNQRLCIEALTHFVNATANLDRLEKLKRAKGPKSAKKLVMNGVSISVQPEIMLRHTIKSSKTIGAVKLVFSKNSPLTSTQGECIAALLNQHLQETKSAAETVLVKNCLVLDVFTGMIFTPPKAFKRKMMDVGAACEEIAVRWEGL